MMQSIFGLFFMLGVTAASPPDQTNDVRCFIVAAEMANSENEEVETAGAIMLFYFLGRLDASSPGADLEMLITRQAEQLTEADRRQLLASCASQVEQRGKDLSRLAE